MKKFVALFAAIVLSSVGCSATPTPVQPEPDKGKSAFEGLGSIRVADGPFLNGLFTLGNCDYKGHSMYRCWVNFGEYVTFTTDAKIANELLQELRHIVPSVKPGMFLFDVPSGGAWIDMYVVERYRGYVIGEVKRVYIKNLPSSFLEAKAGPEISTYVWLFQKEEKPFLNEWATF